MKTLRQADEALDASIGNIENSDLEDLPGIAESARLSTEQVDTTLTTLDGQSIDTAWVTQARRELAGLEKATTRTSLRIISGSSRTSMAGNPIPKNIWPGSIKN